jgi:hypothetical protein
MADSKPSFVNKQVDKEGGVRHAKLDQAQALQGPQYPKPRLAQALKKSSKRPGRPIS